MSTRLRRGSALGAILATLALIGSVARAQDYESHTITIDASTPQPVGTGFIPANSNGELIIFTEGDIRIFPNPFRYEDGWFGPAGHTRLERAGQPILGGMPFGALVGGFSTDIANYRFVGRMGAFHLLPQHVGQEFRVALNMSNADHALMEGSVTVTVIYIMDTSANLARVEITGSTTLPVGTGLVAAAGDQFIVLPYGTIQTGVPLLHYSDSYLGPEGLPGFNRTGQPYPEGPYAGLYGYFADPAVGFYLGDGGTWKVGAPGIGNELHLNLNLDPADLAGADGRFIVNVVRVPQ